MVLSALVTLHLITPLLGLAMQLNCKPRMCGAESVREIVDSVASFPVIGFMELLVGTREIDRSSDYTATLMLMIVVFAVANSWLAGVIAQFVLKAGLKPFPRWRGKAFGGITILGFLASFLLLVYIIGSAEIAFGVWLVLSATVYGVLVGADALTDRMTAGRDKI